MKFQNPEADYLWFDHRQGSKTEYYREEVLKQDPCGYCGNECGLEATIDHIEPKSRGGRDRWDNLARACVQCNQRKRDLPLLKFLYDFYRNPHSVRTPVSFSSMVIRIQECLERSGGQIWRDKMEVREAVSEHYGHELRPARSKVAKYLAYLTDKGFLERRKVKKVNGFHFEYRIKENNAE